MRADYAQGYRGDMSDKTTRPGGYNSDVGQRMATVTLTIAAHPDLRRIGECCFLTDFYDCHPIAIARKQLAFHHPGNSLLRPLEDDFVSRTPFFIQADLNGNLILDPGTVRTLLIANGRPVTSPTRFSSTEVGRTIVLEVAERVCLLIHESSNSQPYPAGFGLIGHSDALMQVREDILRVADLSIPVLIRGETGTGKELVARAIHCQSKRRDKRLVSVNLGAIPATLAAGELFGAVRGAFTGSVTSQTGYFRRAHAGTLFLDEIGEAPAEVQVMLMRVLETGEVLSLGSQTPVSVDVRLLAATDANLEAMSQNGTFKAPLLHRLAAYEIWTPPLRHRVEDIMRLFIFFAQQILNELATNPFGSANPDAPPWIPSHLAAKLVRYSWPGNVRQLRNITRQLIIDHRDRPRLKVNSKLKHLLGGRTAQPEQNTDPSATLGIPVEPESAPGRHGRARKPSQISDEELVAALAEHDWEPAKAASSLSISRPSIYDLIKKCPAVRLIDEIDMDEIKGSLRRHQGDKKAVAHELKVSVHSLRRNLSRLDL